MYLDYSKIAFDAFGRPETPELMLQTLDGRTLGALSNAMGLKINVKLSELSEISFQIAAQDNGIPTPLFDEISGYKKIYTKYYGVYVLMKPVETGDGIKRVKEVKGYSIEKELEFKKFFLEDGTFNFWNPIAPSDTVIGRILEVATGWTVGYISPSLVGRYRTFDSYNDYLLSFIYNTASEKYRCVFVFDPYQKTINAYDANEPRSTLPIYLDFDNLIKSLDVEELSEELVTALRPYGADDLDIRAVNPIGTNWIYDLSYFISNGDIPNDIAEKWAAWQNAILDNQAYYSGLVCLQASTSAQLLAEQAALVDLNNDLQNLINQQSVTIQALALETTADGITYQENLLNEINQKIANKKAEISEKESVIADLENAAYGSNDDSYSSQIKAVNEKLALSKFFTKNELSVLSKYFVEQDMTEETFVATSVDSSVSGDTFSIDAEEISINNSVISEVDLSERFSKKVYTIAGGAFSVHNGGILSGDIIRGSMEQQANGEFVLSIYAGSMEYKSAQVKSGLITVHGQLSSLENDITDVDENGVILYQGTHLAFIVDTGSVYMTANVSEYQKYSVQKELFDYAANILSDLATPTYEFSVDSGNFIFNEEFAEYRDSLELGKGFYLRMHDGLVITPIVIEFELDFDAKNNFSLIFSNRFKRHDNVNTLKNMIEKSYSTTRSFDVNKHIYNQAANQASQVSQFMSSSFDAAKNAIIAAANQSVVIDGTGVHVGGDDGYQLRIIDKMIAMTDDNWANAKIAIGLCASPETGEYWGVNADVLGGKIIIGNNLIMENITDNGIVQFLFDSSGAWLNNGTFILQKDNGGKIIIDPKYGIVGGNGSLFSTNGTTVTPVFVDENNDMIIDKDGFPLNSNFYLDIEDGNAYFRGRIMATSGAVGGWALQDNYLCGGNGKSFVALNGSGDKNSAYAIWAGDEKPESAPFWVKKNGDIYAKAGTFKGTLTGATYNDDSGNAMMNDDYEFTAKYLNLNGINVGNGNFVVDSSGNVTMKGKITMGAESSIDWANVKESNLKKNAAYALAYKNQLPSYIHNTYIDSTKMLSPKIYGAEFYATGQGRNSGAAYYIYDGCEIAENGSVLLGNKIGYISYDDQGAGTDSEAKERVFFTTLNGTALKINASGNISIDAQDFVFFSSRIKAEGGIIMGDSHWGTSLPSTGKTGQIFFLIK